MAQSIESKTQLWNEERSEKASTALAQAAKRRIRGELRKSHKG
jgi:hypothetical protein